MTDTTKQIEQERAPVAADAIRVASRLQSFADRLCNDTSLGEKYEGDETELRTAINMLRHFARATPVSPAQSIDTQEFDDLLDAYASRYEAASPLGMADARTKLVAHINARLAPAKPQTDLHSAIMNLPPARIGQVASALWRAGYSTGHRDARHAAAELVAASVGAQVAGEVVPCEDYGTTIRWQGAMPSIGTKLYTAPVPAPQQKPIARLQSYVSDRPFSKGETFFEVVILDQERCADGMELFGTPVPAPATVDRDAVLEEAIAQAQPEEGIVYSDDELSIRDEIVTAIRALKGKAAPAPVAVAPVAGEGLTDGFGQYDHNLLESCATWLSGRCKTAWAKQFGYTDIMQSYSESLMRIRSAILATQAERQPQPAAQAAPTITINGRQLRDALDAAWPDREDESQAGTELTLFVRTEPAVSSEGEPMEPGLWFYWTDYPEEGVCQLDPESKGEQVAAPAALPTQAAVPEGWQKLTEDCQMDFGRLVDVVLTNGVYEYGRRCNQVDWTQVHDWRYAAPAAVPQGADSQCRNALINRKAGAYPKSCPRCGLAKDCPAGVVIDFSQGVEAQKGGADHG